MIALNLYEIQLLLPMLTAVPAAIVTAPILLFVLWRLRRRR